jgi:hypothetical protein
VQSFTPDNLQSDTVAYILDVVAENIKASDKTVAHEFHLEQLKWLQVAITDRINYLRQIELYAVLGNVGVWTFLLGHYLDAISMRATWCAPVLLNILCIVKRWSVETEMHAVAAYIKLAEERFELPCLGALPSLKGWERWATTHGFRKQFTGYNYAFWAVLLITSIGLATWKIFSSP